MKRGTNAAGFFPEEGDQVTGRYSEVEFAGVVSSARAMTTNWNRFLVGVTLRESIVVNGSVREGILLVLDTDTMSDPFSQDVLTPSSMGAVIDVA
jgi:hypothetical protein